MTSRDRHYWVEQAKPLVASDPMIQQISGIEAWFSIPGQPLKTPLRYKMALLTWGVVYILINFLSLILAPIFQGLPALLASLILSGIMVVFLTYIVMPRVTQIFRSWLFS